MKRSKLINVVAFGFFLSMVSIASVNTADASGFYNILGPNITTEIDDVEGTSYLAINPAQPPDWNPTTLVVQIEHNDGQPLDGISASYEGGTKDLSGYCDTVSYPFHVGFSFVTLENDDPHDLKIRWWFY